MDKEFDKAAQDYMDELIKDLPETFSIEDMRFAFEYWTKCKAGFTITFDKMIEDLNRKKRGELSTRIF